jgi:hypothetical protein
LSRKPSHQGAGICNNMPYAGLRLVLPMPAIGIGRDIITEWAYTTVDCSLR